MTVVCSRGREKRDLMEVGGRYDWFVAQLPGCGDQGGGHRLTEVRPRLLFFCGYLFLLGIENVRAIPASEQRSHGTSFVCVLRGGEESDSIQGELVRQGTAL